MTVKEQVEMLLREYKATGSIEARNRMVELCMPFVESAVKSLKGKTRLGYTLDDEDIVSHGVIGLIRSIDQFEFGRGSTAWPSYAHLFIRREIMDEFRRQSWMRRVCYDKHINYEKIADAFFSEHGYRPTHEEMVNFAGLDEDDLARHWDNGKVSYMPPLSDRSEQGASEIFPVDARSPVARDRMDEILNLIGFGPMGAEMKMIAKLFYGEGMTQAEIGRVVGICDSRVSQLLGRIDSIFRSNRCMLSPDNMSA